MMHVVLPMLPPLLLFRRQSLQGRDTIDHAWLVAKDEVLNLRAPSNGHPEPKIYESRINPFAASQDYL